MNRYLQTLSLFLHLVHGHKITGEGPFHDDLYPRQLDVILRHCSDDRIYRQFAIITVDDELSSKFYRTINERFGIPVQVFRDIKWLSSLEWRTCVLLYLTDREVINFLQSVETHRWLPNNVYVLHAPYSIRHTWTLTAAELWRRKNVHKFVLSSNESNLVFDPFALSTLTSEDKLSRDSFGAPKDLGDSAALLEVRDTFEGFEVNVALFPYETVQKVNGTWSGMEVYAMAEICNGMNVTARVFEPPEAFGWDDNGNFTGALGMLVYRKVDFAFNGFFIKDYRSRDLEFTEFLEMDKIYVIVPRLGRVPEYLLMARIFTFDSWTLIIVGNALIGLTYMGIASVTFGRVGIQGLKLEKFSSNSPKSLNWFDRLTRVTRFLALWFLHSVYPTNSNTNWSGVRLVLAFGLMLGIVMTGSFTSQLASSLSKPAFLKNIDTLKELDDSGLQILTHFPNLIDDVFTDTELPALRNLRLKLHIKDESEIVKQVFDKRKAGYLDRRHSEILRSGEAHFVPEYPKEYHLAYPIMKGSPFLPRINQIIGRLHNGGFYHKWFHDSDKPSKQHYANSPVVIRLPHLYITFFILFVGLGVSGAAFSYELMHPPRRLGRKRHEYFY